MPEQPHQWVLETLPRALAFATSLVRDRDLAEEVVHDCYCKLLEKADVYDLARDGFKILLRAITNASIDRTARRRVLLSLEACRDGARADQHLVDLRAREPSEAAMTRELEQALEEGLGRLSLGQRAALQLKVEGYTLQEIAETLQVTVSNAGVLIHRARQALAEHLAPYREEHAR